MRLPPFFDRLGLGLGSVLDGEASQFACGGDGAGLKACHHLAIRGLGGCLLDLAGHEQGLLDQQRLQRCLCIERARCHGVSLLGLVSLRLHCLNYQNHLLHPALSLVGWWCVCHLAGFLAGILLP